MSKAGTPPAPKYRFKDQTEAERAHSELQSRYSRLGDPEQAAQALSLLNSLKADEKFREWAQTRLAEQEAGSGDPETVKAMQIVEAIADRKAREMVGPIYQQEAQRRLAMVGHGMKQAHGPEWLEAKTDMDAFYMKGVQAGVFAQNSNPYLHFEITDALYKAVRGEQREAKAYQKKLEAKQATTTQSTPGLAPSSAAAPQTKGIEGALRAAMKQHGLA